MLFLNPVTVNGTGVPMAYTSSSLAASIEPAPRGVAPWAGRMGRGGAKDKAGDYVVRGTVVARGQ